VKAAKRWHGYWRLFGVSAVMLGLTFLLVFFYISYNNQLNIIENDVTYDKVYVMITDDPGADFWQSVYESAFKAGKKKNVYVEEFSQNFTRDYSKYELMEIAIASGVDGIIVSANESEEMTRLINQAAEHDIPVVTLYSDNTLADRLSFVGISNYNLGNEYAELIVDMVHKKVLNVNKIRVKVLVDANADDYGQNILLSAIQERIEKENLECTEEHPMIEISTHAIEATNNFSVEESVRSMFMLRKTELPDIVVCLNEIDTTSLYQAVVDYNAVGMVNILGYYDSEAILKGIERDVIYATVSIDAAKMGEYCIDALSEYYEMGYTNQYFSTDISIIDKDNIYIYQGGQSND